jgi:hypothetical protein
MERLEFEFARPHFFILLFICCITLLTGCDINDNSTKSDNSDSDPDSSAEIVLTETVQTESTTNFSVGAQQLSSNQYKSSSIIGEIAGSKMESQKYKLTAAFVVPNKISNKQGL